MKILVASKISPEALEALGSRHDVVFRPNASEEELLCNITDRHALIFRSGVQITDRVLSAAPELDLIIRAGSGYDNIDLDHLSNRPIHFIRVPGPGAKAVAELSFALMLALARQVFWADRQWRAGHWVKPQASGRLLTGRVLGIVGAGNIGARTGALGAAWGMSVIGCVEDANELTADRLQGQGIELESFAEVLRRADFLSVHVPLQDSTRGLLGREELLSMKADSFLINLARGGVVDESALREVLESGHLAGAALDVHEREGDGQISPLARFENVILTPHIGASTLDSQREIGEIILRCVDDYEHLRPSALGTPNNFIVM